MKKLTTLILFALASASFALQGGPSQPDYTEFEPSGMTDMVDLLSGNFSYQIPLSDVPSPYGNYPLSISYHAGISPQQEASWVGLGWSLNPGAINRAVRGVPDDQIHGGTLGFIYQYSYARAWSLDVAYSNSVFSVGQTASSDGTVGFSVTCGWKIAGVGQVGFSLGTGEIGLTGSVGYGGARVKAGLTYSKNGLSASIGGGVGMASLGAQISSGNKVSANVGFGNSTVGGGLTVSSEGVSSHMSVGVGASSFIVGDKGAGVSIYASGSGLPVSNSSNEGSEKISRLFIGVIVPTKIGVFSAGYGQVLNEYWIRAATVDNVYGYIYQAGPAIDVKSANNISGLPDVEEAYIKSIIRDDYWDKEIKGRTLESMGDADMSPAYDMYYVSSEGARGTFRPFAREKHQLYKKISNEKTKDYKSIEVYSTLLEDDATTGWPYKKEFKKDSEDEMMLLGNTYNDYAYCLHSSGECSVYGMYQTNFRNRGNRLVFNSDPAQSEERGGIRFLFVGENGGYYESEDVDGSESRPREEVSESLLKRKVGDFEYALYGSKKIEPMFEDDSPIGRLKGFIITGTNGNKYYFTKPVQSYLKVDYALNREKGTPIFVDFKSDASAGVWDNILKGVGEFVNFVKQTYDTFFGKGTLVEKCNLEEFKKSDDYFFSYAANINSYATQWLLSEIQGADYLKVGDKEIGYNVKFSYTEPLLYRWRTPFARPGVKSSELPNFRAARNAFTPKGCDSRLYQASFGIKEYVYLKSIETASHRVDFELNTDERVDGKGWETGKVPMPPIFAQISLGMEMQKMNEFPEAYISKAPSAISESDKIVAYWVHKITWRPKYVYFNFKLPEVVLDAFYNGEPITINGLDPTSDPLRVIWDDGVEYKDTNKVVKTNGLEKINFVFEGGDDQRSFEVVKNSFERTSGDESRFGLYRLELKSNFSESSVYYMQKNIKDYIKDLPKGSLISIGLSGDLVQNLYANMADYFNEKTLGGRYDNEMRYLTKISYYKKNDETPYKEYLFDYDYSLQPKTLNSYCKGRYPAVDAIEDIVNSPDSVGLNVCKTDLSSNYLYGKLTLRSITEKGCQGGKCASLPPFKFSYNTPSATSTRISDKGKWIGYFQEKLAKSGEDDVVNIDEEYFKGFTDLDATILATSSMMDEYGFWSNSANPENHKVDQSFADFGASAWSLNKVVDPAGGNLEVEYERDRYGTGVDYSQNKRTVVIDDFKECSEYSNVDSKYDSDLCIAITPLYWREQCLGPQTAYWDATKPKGFRGSGYAYLDSMEVQIGSNLFFNLFVELTTDVECGFLKLFSCPRDRGVSIVGDGVLENIVFDGDSKAILVLNRRMDELYVAGQNAADKINDSIWSFKDGGRSGYVWAGKKLDQVKAGDLRVTRLTRHDIGLKSLTSYEYDAGEIAQLADSSYTTVLGNRFFSTKISEVVPDVHLDPISRIVGIDDKDLMYLPGPKISYPKVTVKNSSEDTSMYNGSTEFFYITPETGVPEEFIDPETRASLKPFVKVNIQNASMNSDDDYDNGVVYNIVLQDAKHQILEGTEPKKVLMFPGDRVSLYFYSEKADLAKYVMVGKPNRIWGKTVEMWDSESLIESLRTPFTKYNEVSVAVYNGDEGSVKVLSKRSQKKGFFPILYKKCDYEQIAVDFEAATGEKYDGVLIDYETNVTYHDFSAFLGQNYKIVSKRGTGNDAVVLMMDSSVYSTVVPNVVDHDIPDSEKYKIGRQVEKWSSDLQMQCVDGKGEENLAGNEDVCKKQAMNLYMRASSGAKIHKEYKYVRYPVFQIEDIHYVGYDNPKFHTSGLPISLVVGNHRERVDETVVDDQSEKFSKTKINNYAYEALTGTPTATLATMYVGNGNTLRKLTNVTPYYMASEKSLNHDREYFDLSNEMFLRNMLTQNYMEEIYTDTLKSDGDASWNAVKTNENLRSFSVSPYRVAPSKLFNGAVGKMPLLALGTFQSKVKPSVIRPTAMKFVDGTLDYEGKTLKNVKGSLPSLEEYTGSEIVAINEKYKVTEIRDVFKRSLTTLFSEDGMFQLGLFFPAKREEVGAILAYGDASYNSANCTELQKAASNGEIMIDGSGKKLSCNVTTDSKNMVMEYRYWASAKGWVTERKIVSPSKVELEIPDSIKLNYFRVYPEGAEAKTFIYDKYGNIIQIVAEDNTSTYYEYDPLGFLVQSRNDDGVSFKAHHREYMNNTSALNGAKE